MRLCIFILVVTNILVVFEQASSQEKTVTRSVGLSASIQGEQLDIMVPIWAGNKTVIAPAFSFAYAEDAGKDWALGVAPRFYMNMDRIASYVGVRAAAFVMSTSGNGNTTLDWLVGLAMGGEYFINAKFSFGIEAQANFTISDDQSGRFGNPGGLNFNTATAMFACIYF